jgi:hypothetical protein
MIFDPVSNERIRQHLGLPHEPMPGRRRFRDRLTCRSRCTDEAYVSATERRTEHAGLERSVKRAKIEDSDRIFWSLMRRMLDTWRDTWLIVKPETVIRWHRQGNRTTTPPRSRLGLRFSTVSDYRPQSEDCTEAVDRLVFERVRAMTPEERLLQAMDAYRAVERLSIAGLRAQYPEASAKELFRRAGARRLGRELTLRAYGPEAEAWLD